MKKGAAVITIAAVLVVAVIGLGFVFLSDSSITGAMGNSPDVREDEFGTCRVTTGNDQGEGAAELVININPNCNAIAAQQARPDTDCAGCCSIGKDCSKNGDADCNGGSCAGQVCFSCCNDGKTPCAADNTPNDDACQGGICGSNGICITCTPCGNGQIDDVSDSSILIRDEPCDLFGPIYRAADEDGQWCGPDGDKNACRPVGFPDKCSCCGDGKVDVPTENCEIRKDSEGNEPLPCSGETVCNRKTCRCGPPPVPTPAPTPGPFDCVPDNECGDDDECGTGGTCPNGFCVCATPTPTPFCGDGLIQTEAPFLEACEPPNTEVGATYATFAKLCQTLGNGCNKDCGCCGDGFLDVAGIEECEPPREQANCGSGQICSGTCGCIPAPTPEPTGTPVPTGTPSPSP